jgi:hypothetical protein
VRHPQRALEARRRSAGLCPRCGNIHEGSFGVCAPCLEVKRQKSRELRAARRRDGKCIECGAEAKRFARCLACRCDLNARVRKCLAARGGA